MLGKEPKIPPLREVSSPASSADKLRETEGVRSNTPPDLRSDSPQGENKLSKVEYSSLNKEGEGGG